MRAVNCAILFPYSNSDYGSGRCRMSKSAMIQNQIFSLGTCAKLALHFDDRVFSVLCTVWPDSSDCLSGEECSIDDSVCFGLDSPFWTECRCEVVDTWIPNILTSLYVKHDGTNVKSSDLLGMAIMAGCTVRTLKHNSVRQAVLVSRTSAQKVGIVTTATLVINETNKTDETAALLSTDGIHGASAEKAVASYCNISVVNEITQRVVMPYVAHNNTHLNTSTWHHSTPPLIHGLLLVGPPGVGKTYAVKAVQRLCAQLCKIRIFEVSIPTLLSSADPLGELRTLFASISKLRRSPALDNSQCDSAISSTPSTPGSSKYSSLSTPSTARGLSSTPATRQNTFTYRSPAAMAAAAQTAAALPQASVLTSSCASPLPSPPPTAQTQVPSTPMSKASASRTPSTTTAPDSAFSFAKKGGRAASATPPPSSFKDMLAASRASSSKASKAPIIAPATVAEDSAEPLRSVVNYSPEIAFIVVDEIDALGKDGMQNENQIVIKQFLCRWLDEQNSNNARLQIYRHHGAVACCMVGTSNRSGDIDAAFRRGGRLEHEVAVQNTQEDRSHLLQRLIADTFCASDPVGAPVLSACEGEEHCEHKETEKRPIVTLSELEVRNLADKIAMQTGGYVAADLSALVTAIAKLMSAEPASINGSSDRTTAIMRSFHIAAKSVTPSCLRGATISLPNLTFDDVIGNDEVKKSLQRVMSFAKPEKQDIAARFGLTASPGGVLLYGPPGNSKTRMASAAAVHFGLPMISLSAADIYSPYVGDAEAEVRRAFQLARQAAPCVLFIDELDSIVTNRANDSGGGSSSASVEGRVLATLLTEMDGIQNTNSSEYSQSGGGKSGQQNSSGGVIVLGATNRLDFIDAALIRKGRFHHVLHVAPPNAAERELLLGYFAAKCGLPVTTSGVQAVRGLQARLKDGMSGAEIENICKEAALSLYSQQLAQV